MMSGSLRQISPNTALLRSYAIDYQAVSVVVQMYMQYYVT